MRGFFVNVGHGLSGLLHFRGRDGLGPFWQYALFLFLIMFFIPAPPALDLFRELGTSDRAAFLARVAPTDEEHMYLNLYEVQGMFAIIRQAFLLLLTAAMVRRLHDVGRSGAHALLNCLLGFGSLGAALLGSWDFGQSYEMMQHARGYMMWITLLWLTHFTYLAVQLARKSDPDFNRGGEPALTPRKVQIETLRGGGSFGRKTSDR